MHPLAEGLSGIGYPEMRLSGIGDLERLSGRLSDRLSDRKPFACALWIRSLNSRRREPAAAGAKMRCAAGAGAARRWHGGEEACTSLLKVGSTTPTHDASKNIT